MPVIYSTLSCDQSYRLWDCEYKGATNEKGFRTPNSTFQFLVNGQANITNKILITPNGVATVCTVEQLEQLKKCACFNNHVNGGYLLIDEGAKNTNAEKADKVAVNMTAKDNSAPKTEKDIPKGVKVKATSSEQ